MSSPDKSMFFNKKVCKECLIKPCRLLLAGPVYPGKMIFVHQSKFLSNSCFELSSFSNAEEQNGSDSVISDEIEVITQNVEISNPRWESVDGASMEGEKEIPVISDKIRLCADVKNYAEGASVTFDIYDVTESSPIRIATVKGVNNSGKASAEWTIIDPQKHGENLKLSFEAGARNKYTEKADLPLQNKIICDFVELPDVLFHKGSAIPCLDEAGVLLGGIISLYKFIKENPGKEIVIFGHTDSSGDPASNYDLSQWRAEAIKALLDNKSEAWLDIVDLASKVEDYQTILKTLAVVHGWNCNPGSVDNTDGPKTKAAVKAFQIEYNTRFKGNLEKDGIIGWKTWEALFCTIRSILEEKIKKVTGEPSVPTLTYGYNGKGVYGCGGSFPIDTAAVKGTYQSVSAQRVEIAFFSSVNAPKLCEPADKTAIKKTEVPLYDPKKAERTVIQTIQTGNTAADNPDVKKNSVLEIEDVLFNLNSAVMLPAAPESTTSNQGSTDKEGIGIATMQKKTTGLNVVRAIYRFIEKYPEKKLIIAGHADTSGSIKTNFTISDLRAQNVLHLLLGNGDAWAETCFKKHSVEDYQQILKHIAQLLLWPCDPGKIDNKSGPKTKKAVKSFQELYNAHRSQMNFSGGQIEAKEPLGDELNKETWRAFFDVYRWEAAVITVGDQDTKLLDGFIKKISFVDDNRKTLACGESFPIDKKDKSNYKSQLNRRVELLFFDEGEAPESIECPEPGDANYTENDVPFYNKKRYTSEYIKLTGPSFIPVLDIQSVDSIGHPVPENAITVTSDNKDIDPRYTKNIKTDGDAFVRIFGVPQGTIEVKDTSGKLLKMLVGGKEVDASFNSREIMNGIISIIVKEVPAEVKKKQIRQRKTYSPVPTDDSTTLKPISLREQQVQQVFNAGAKARFVATDNLLMAAGLNSNNQENIKKLVSDTLHTWLEDYFPVVIKKDYIVYHFYSVNSQFKVGIYTSGGDLLGTFDLIQNLVALVGAYSIFESVKEQVFVDMAYRRFKIVVEGSNQVHDLETIIAENQRSKFSEIVNTNISRIQISYYCRSVSHLASISLAGGTGYLETYSDSNSKINEHIHERNIGVVKMHSLMYQVYINAYTKKVEDCADEDQLRKLGPPMRVYRYPTPVNATDSQMSELFHADNSSSAEYHAWLAIAEKINKFTDRRSEGFYFLAKYTYEKNVNKLQKVQFEYNFTVDADGKLLKQADVKILTGFETEIDSKVKNKLTSKKVVAGVEHELSLITGDSKVTGKLKVGKYGVELANDGSAKLTNGPIASEVNPSEKTFGTGVDVEIGEGQKIYIGMHFQGLREDTVLAFVSNAPGFFERRSHKELLATTTKWNDLTYAEQDKLEKLGFTMEFWDDKHNHLISEFPPSASKNYNDLSAEEQIAIVHLGFNSTTWPSLIKATAATTSKEYI